jgi:F-type H+-transporting ATPase subunit b
VLIDWFTVSAQVVNFLILVYLLKRFLYGPILQAMDRREQEIGDRLRDAAEKREAAENEAEAYRSKAREVEEERPRRLKAVEEEVEKRRRELLSRAKEEVEELREAWRASMVREQRNFLDELKRRTGSEVVRIAGRALAELADADLAEGLAARFCERLNALDPKEKERWSGTAAQEEVVLRSPFELEPSLRDRIVSALQEVCGREPRLSCRTDPDMPLGIELTAGGVRLSWGLESYLEDLEKDVTELLQAQAASAEAPAGESGGEEEK